MAWNLNHSISELSTYMYMYKLLNERNIERSTADCISNKHDSYVYDYMFERKLAEVASGYK